MSGIFSYDSKLSKGFRTVMDAVILNLLFILCSLPLVTLGASMAALHSGIRELMSKREEDGPEKAPIRVFFEALKDGFWTITALSAIGVLVVFILCYNLILVLGYYYSGLNAPVVLALIGLALVFTYLCTAGVFHAHFSCRFGLLCKNVFNLMFSHPLRALATAALFLIPAAVGLFSEYYLLIGTPVWVLVYFSLSAMLMRLMWKSVFDKLASHAILEK